MTRTQWALPFAILALLLTAAEHSLAAGPRPVITVVAAYPGADAQVVADTVAAPIEEQVNGVEKMLSMASQSGNDGTYNLDVTFEPGVDLDMARVLVQDRVSLAQPGLPDAVKGLGVTVKKKSPGVLMFVTMFSPDGRYDQLYLGNYATLQLKDELARLPGVSEVVLFGGQDYGLSVRLDPDALAARNLMASDVTWALAEEKTLNRPTSAEQLADTILKTNADGRTVRLKEVARIEQGASSRRSQALLDGKPAVALGVYALPQAPLREVSPALRDKLAELRRRLPDGLDFSLDFDFTSNRESPERSTTPGYLLVKPGTPDGVSTERMPEFLEQSEEVLMKSVGVQHVLALSEDPFARWRDGPCVLALLDGKQAGREPNLESLRGRLGRVEEGAPVRLYDLSGPGRLQAGGHLIDLALSGPEPYRVEDFGQKLVPRLAPDPHLTDLAAGPGTAAHPLLYVDVDRTAAKVAGVSLADISDTLQAYLGSVPVNAFNGSGRTWKVQVQLETSARDQAEGIKRLKIRNAGGQMIPLSRFVTVREVGGPVRIDRLDLRPMVEITANPPRGVSLAQARWLCETRAEEVRKDMGLSSDYRLAWLQDLPEPKPIPGGQKAAAEDSSPLEVMVSRPVVREVTDYEDFTGRTQAVNTVDVRSRITGYLDKVMFKEGAEVKQGDLLFEIDPRPYQAALDQAQAHLRLGETQLKSAEAVYNRDVKFAATGAVSQEQVDQSLAQRDVAAAQLKASQAALEQAKLILDYTRVTAPLNGLIGRRLLDPGNLVKADESLLATIVSLDPMYATFDMDEATLLRLRRAVNDGKIKRPQEAASPVFMALQGEADYPHQGTIDFVNNQVDPSTGSIAVRAVFPNPRPAGGVPLLSPGMFVRIRMPIGQPYKALLVTERAVGSDQGLKYVYVLDSDNKVQYRRVTTGPLQEDGLRVISEGLQPDDHVLVGGMGRVRPRMLVKPQEVAMPVLSTAPK